MELILDIFFWIMLISIPIMNVFILKRLDNIEKYEDSLIKFQSCMVDAINEQTEQINRSMLALKESIEPTKPIKTNNWDSIAKAFKGPTRIEVNERN